MEFLLEIARKVQTPQRESYPINNELNEINELTLSVVVENRSFTEKSVHIPKANPTPTEERQPPAKVMAVWPPNAQSLIDWFVMLDPPKEPFHLKTTSTLWTQRNSSGHYGGKFRADPQDHGGGWAYLKAIFGG